MINFISGIQAPWAPVQASRVAPTPAPTPTVSTPESSDGASISTAALQSSEPAAEAPSKTGSSRLMSFATSLGLALCLAGPLSGCATMTGMGALQPQVRQEQTVKDSALLHNVGSGTHKMVDGAKDIGKGIGSVFVEGWNQVREGWNSTGETAPKPAQKQAAPAKHHAPQHKAQPQKAQ